MPPKHRRQSASGSPSRRVNFVPGMISGPSGSTLQPNVDGGLEDIDFEDEDMDTPDHQLHHDLHRHFTDPLSENPDEEICQDMKILIGEILDFAKLYQKKSRAKDVMKCLLDATNKEQNKELIRYIGCIALAGTGGKNAWKDLLTGKDTREAVVVGIIGRALEEHVFSALYFGGGKELQTNLKKLERDQANGDGFSRTRERAQAIKKFKPADKNNHFFNHDVGEITARIAGLLWAFEKINLDAQLYGIVFRAGRLSQRMRASGDVVYYWPPTFKDEEYEPGRMEATNLDDMIKNSPYERKMVGDHARSVLKQGYEEQGEAIVRVVCFPGLVAYRQYGGELARKELAMENDQGDGMLGGMAAHRRHPGDLPLTERAGIRSKVICKSLVLLMWGKQRLLTKEAGTSTHIDAVRDGKLKKYEDDNEGAVELLDLALESWKKAKH